MIIVTGGSESEDTPDHNALQLRFLDRAFQLAFLEAALRMSASDCARSVLRHAVSRRGPPLGSETARKTPQRHSRLKRHGRPDRFRDYGPRK